LINTLAQIGDQNVAETLAEHYPRLKETEQVAVLTLLGQLRSPLLLKLAPSALKSSDPNVVNTVCQWLSSDGSSASVELLIQTLDAATQQTTIIYSANALGQTATPEARKALRRARTSSDPQKQRYARTVLQSVLNRSPAMTLVIQASNLELQGDVKNALETITAAIKLDPELPEAYISRANKLIKQNKYADAQKDFEKAYSLDDFSSEAVTGVGITLAIAGRFEEGVKILEENRAKFPNDNLFLYNAACVYGRAAEFVQKNEKIPDRDKKLVEFQGKAIADLRESIKAGFDEFDWMKKHPDHNSLHELPGFKELTK
jgi:tetratricopeptide (TPR) repeat protein